MNTSTKSNQITAMTVNCVINNKIYQIRGTCDVDVHFTDMSNLYDSVMVVEVNISISICILSICHSARMTKQVTEWANCCVRC